jgi:Secretion system C-terminal sorting domain
MRNLIFIFLCLTNLVQAQIYQGNLELNTQAQVDALPPYNQVQGTIYLRPVSGDTICDIHDLSNLSELRSVGAIWVQKTSLRDFHGLDSIEDGPSEFIVVQNTLLDNLSGLEKISPSIYGTVFLEYNPNLRYLTRFVNLKEIDVFKIKDCPRFESLEGLDSLNKVDGSLRVLGANIKNLKGLGGLRSVRYDLEIADCDSLVSVRDCGFTKKVGLGIWRCNQLKYLDFLPSDTPEIRVGVIDCANFQKLLKTDLKTKGDALFTLVQLPKLNEFNLIEGDTVSIWLQDCPKLAELKQKNIDFLSRITVDNCDNLEEINIINGGDPNWEPEDRMSRKTMLIISNKLLKKISFPSARYSTEVLFVSGNTSLTTVDFGSLDYATVFLLGGNFRNIDGFPNLVEGGLSIFQSRTDSIFGGLYGQPTHPPSEIDLDSIISFKKLRATSGINIDAHVRYLDAFDSLKTVQQEFFNPDRFPDVKFTFANLEIDSLSFPRLELTSNGLPFAGEIVISKTKLKQPITFSPGFKLNTTLLIEGNNYVKPMSYKILDNPNMTSLDKLSLFSYSGDTLPSFTILNNLSLADCSYFCDIASQGYTTDLVRLENNPGTCISLDTALVNCTVSTGEVQYSEVAVFPIPASDYLVIQTPNLDAPIEELILYNMQGNRVRNLFNLAAYARLDIQDLSSGMYVLVLRQPNGNTQQHKVIVVR